MLSKIHVQHTGLFFSLSGDEMTFEFLAYLNYLLKDAIFLAGPRLNSTRRSAMVLCLSSVKLNSPFLTG